MIEFLKYLFFINPLNGLVSMFAFVWVVGMAIILVSIWRKDVEIPEMNSEFFDSVIKSSGTYALWGMAQQTIIVTVFFWVMKLTTLDYGFALVFTALFFGLVCHFGNRGLMGWTVAMALVYLPHWQHYHNIYIIGVAHGILGT